MARIAAIGMVDQLAEKSLGAAPFTQLANLTGQPAMSVPLAMSSNGLPIGLQFVAARGKEDLLFRFAAELERTEHWIKCNPLEMPGLRQE